MINGSIKLPDMLRHEYEKRLVCLIRERRQELKVALTQPCVPGFRRVGAIVLLVLSKKAVLLKLATPSPVT